MAKNGKRKKRRVEWTPFEEAVWPGDPKDLGENGVVYRNSRYQVIVADVPGWPVGCSKCGGEGGHRDSTAGKSISCIACDGSGEVAMPVKHLSIKRLSKGVVHDWRELQRIKNELTHPECEAVELYPAELGSLMTRISIICGSFREG